MNQAFVDIHCHMLPGVDDGARDLEDALAMARVAVDDGITHMVLTPHQLGSFDHNEGDDLRRRAQALKEALAAAEIPLCVLPGAEARIEEGLVDQVRSGRVLTLGDHGRHVLLELPHDIYFPIDTLLEQFALLGITAILAHPERNGGILQKPQIVSQLVEAGCLMQVTAGSLVGTWGSHCQRLAHRMLIDGLVHFVSTDAHGPRKRRPLLGRAFDHARKLVGDHACAAMFYENPMRALLGQPVPSGRLASERRCLGRWFSMGRAG